MLELIYAYHPRRVRNGAVGAFVHAVSSNFLRMAASAIRPRRSRLRSAPDPVTSVAVMTGRSSRLDRAEVGKCLGPMC